MTPPPLCHRRDTREPARLESGERIDFARQRGRGGVIGIDFGTTNTVVSTLGDGRRGAPGPLLGARAGELVAFRSALSFHARRGRRRRAARHRGRALGDRGLCGGADRDPLHPVVQELRGQPAASGDARSSAAATVSRTCSRPSCCGCAAHAGAGMAEPAATAHRRPAGDLRRRRARPEPWPSRATRPPSSAWASATSATPTSRSPRPSSSPARSTRDATVLVGDFGGGTSDFSIVRFHREGGEIRATPLANAGVGVAGDAFDYRIIDNLVSPCARQGVELQDLRQHPADPQPLLRRLRPLGAAGPAARLARHARHPRPRPHGPASRRRSSALVELLDDNHGYRLYQAVSRLKEGAVAARGSRLPVRGRLGAHREAGARAPSFEAWIAPELAAMDERRGRSARPSGPRPGGRRPGVPHRRLLLRAGGAAPVRPSASATAKLEGGGELVSIASGLAYMGAERDLDAWTVRGSDLTQGDA